MDNGDKICRKCGSKLLTKTTYELDSTKVGKVRVYNVEYEYCQKCNIDYTPVDVFNKWKELERHLILNALAKRLNNIEDINNQYMSSKEFASLLDISERKLLGKSINMKILHNTVYNISLFGHRYYLRESVAKFITTGNGIFLLT